MLQYESMVWQPAWCLETGNRVALGVVQNTTFRHDEICYISGLNGIEDVRGPGTSFNCISDQLREAGKTDLEDRFHGCCRVSTTSQGSVGRWSFRHAAYSKDVSIIAKSLMLPAGVCGFGPLCTTALEQETQKPPSLSICNQLSKSRVHV